MPSRIVVDRHLVRLDEAAGPTIIRHLLGHASVLSSEQRPVSAPGKRRTYSDGVEVLGKLVADKGGRSFQEWVEETVLETPAPILDPHRRIAPSCPWSFSQSRLRRASVSYPLSFGATADTTTTPGATDSKLKQNKSPLWLGKTFLPLVFDHIGRAGSFRWVDLEAQRNDAYFGDENVGKTHGELWTGFPDKMRAVEEF